MKNFTTQIERPLFLVPSAYVQAKVRVGDRGLLLEPPSPPLSHEAGKVHIELRSRLAVRKSIQVDPLPRHRLLPLLPAF
jgi:hypothetical protein